MNLCLRVAEGKSAGRELRFPTGEFYFGRGPECQVRLNVHWVSRQHCLLRVATQGVTVRDLASRNGTLVNGILIHGEQALQSGDRLQVGPALFVVELSGDGDPGFTGTAELGEGDGRPPSDSTASHEPLR